MEPDPNLGHRLGVFDAREFDGAKGDYARLADTLHALVGAARRFAGMSDKSGARSQCPTATQPPTSSANSTRRSLPSSREVPLARAAARLEAGRVWRARREK
jgi:hypothetical protein